MSSTHRMLLLTAGAALAAALPGSTAAAKDEAPPVMATYLESLELAPGIEYRLAVLYPVMARPKPQPGDEVHGLAGVTAPDLLALGRIASSAKSRIDAVSFAPEPSLVLAGDVLRTPTSDQVVTEDALLRRGKPAELRVARISHEVPEDPAAAETSFVGEVLPSPLRYLVMTHAPAATLRAAADTWADDVKLATPRRSPAELGTAEPVAKRFSEYRKALAELPRPQAGSGRELVGVVALLDGEFASMETFASGDLFRRAWPKLLAGIAAEAVASESRQNLLGEDLAAPADPDRFVANVKQRLLGLFAARYETQDVPDGAKRLVLTVDAASAEAIVLGEASRFVHFVLVTDPAHREEKKKDPESPDPNVAARKARPTEEEKRLLERRGRDGQPQPAPPKPADPPPAPPPAPK